MSAIVEPIGAVMGAALVMWMMAIIPYALAFAAGAMIFVVTEELIPESQTNGNTDVATLGLMVGFVVMMVMEWPWAKKILKSCAYVYRTQLFSNRWSKK